MQIAIIQTEAEDFVKINICVILKTFGNDCWITLLTLYLQEEKETHTYIGEVLANGVENLKIKESRTL